MTSRNHPGLFDDIDALPPPPPGLVALGNRIPASIKFGTSTWTYDGWTGDVYHRAYRGAQPARRLEEYARYPLFRTVGIDSAFYEPPSEEALAAYARALPAGFPCVSKVWDRHGVAHVCNSWNEMPGIGEQLELPWTFPAGFTVARGLLRPGRRYADAVKLFEPYEGIREPQPDVRHDLLRVVAEALRRRIEALILVNNRLEGNAPGTIRALAAALAGEEA